MSEGMRTRGRSKSRTRRQKQKWDYNVIPQEDGLVCEHHRNTLCASPTLLKLGSTEDPLELELRRASKIK
jgi:hypothetical protein